MKKAMLPAPSGSKRDLLFRRGWLAGISALGLCMLFAAGSPGWPQETEGVKNDAAAAFATFEASGAGTGAMQGTVALGINTAGDVTGTYLDAKGVAHGFVRAANGTIATFSAPGAGTAPGPRKNGTGSPYFQGTVPVGINAAGVIAGTYIDTNYNYHGFVRAANGTIASFDVPGDITVSPYQQAMGTRPTAINAAGEITGIYLDPSACYHGFIRAANAKITTFDAPGAGTCSEESSILTFLIGIDAAGDTVGTYLPNTSNDSPPYSGVLHTGNDKVTSFNPPGAGATGEYFSEYAGTLAIGINTSQTISGTYTDAHEVRHGFVRPANGEAASFDAPGAGTGLLRGFGGELEGTVGVGINDAGEIAGGDLDADAVYHGFLRSANGAITAINAPNAGDDALQGTIAFGINTAGTVVGTYADSNFVFHGFVFTAATLAATKTSLASAPNPSSYLEPVTLNAEVGAASGGTVPPNGETVRFLQGTTELGSAELHGGKATLTTTALPVGSDSITAAYSGDSNFAGSTSIVVKQAVGKANSFTGLTSSKNPSEFGEPVTFTATVSGQFGGTATGTVTFNQGSTKLGTATLSKGTAKFTTTALPVGTDSIKAVYSGDTNFVGSTSEAVAQVVGKATTALALTTSDNPSESGQSVTFTATVKAQYGGTLTGTVTFNDGKTALKTVSLSGGVAKFATSSLAAGTHSMKATYGGSTDFAGSSGALTQTVK